MAPWVARPQCSGNCGFSSLSLGQADRGYWSSGRRQAHICALAWFIFPYIMNKSRLEAFTDGVVAIAITIMVLALKVPSGPHWSEVLEMAPVLCAYLLSFVYVGIYWVNHNHSNPPSYFKILPNGNFP